MTAYAAAAGRRRTRPVRRAVPPLPTPTPGGRVAGLVLAAASAALVLGLLARIILG